MTQDEIIEMARQAGWPDWEIVGMKSELKAFAKLVAAKERDALLQSTIQAHEVGGFTDVVACSAIRARGEA